MVWRFNARATTQNRVFLELVVSNGEIVIVLQTVGIYEGERFEAKYTGHFAGDEPVSAISAFG